MLKDEVIAQRPDGPGVGERIGRRVVGAADRARASYAAEKAARRELMRPALNDAIGRARDAERELSFAKMRLGQTCAALLLGEAEETDVEAVEREIAEAERDVRRYEAAAREIEQRLGIVRDPGGVILR